MKLLEPVVIIKCLERDVNSIEKILPACKQLFKEVIRKELDIELPLEVIIDKNRFLELRKIEQKTSNSGDEEASNDPSRVPKNLEDKKWYYY